MSDYINGLVELPWWGYVLVTLALTHITIASVTIFLHRAQAHRALDLHPIASHFLPFLALAHHRHRDQGVGQHPPQAPRQVRDPGRSPQSAGPRHRESAAGRRRTCIGRRPKTGKPWNATVAAPRTTGWSASSIPPTRPSASASCWPSTSSCSAPSASPSGPCRCCGFPSPPPASSTASAITGVTATSPARTPAPTSCPGAS
jgi:hypothetical protein